MWKVGEKQDNFYSASQTPAHCHRLVASLQWRGTTVSSPFHFPSHLLPMFSEFWARCVCNHGMKGRKFFYGYLCGRWETGVPICLHGFLIFLVELSWTSHFVVDFFLYAAWKLPALLNFHQGYPLSKSRVHSPAETLSPVHSVISGWWHFSDPPLLPLRVNFLNFSHNRRRSQPHNK